jgi:predicted DNA-binding transcriptional regulator YafY
MKTDRLLAIVIKMLNRQNVSAKELADYFEVSVRTIQRDIDAINMAGIPVVASRGNVGGYSILENFKINNSFFTSTEQNLLLTTLQGVYKAYNDNSLTDIIDKLSLIKTSTTSMGKNHIIMDFSSWWNSEKQKEKVDKIKGAIENNKVICFDYFDMNGETSKRELEAINLILKVNVWYIYGFCRLRQDYRLFKMTRVKNLQVTEQKYKSKENFKEYKFDYNNSGNIKLKLKFDKSAINRIDDYFGIEDLTFNANGDILVEIYYNEDEWVYGMILSFGDKVEVIEPMHIRGIIKTRLQKTLNKYMD